MFMKKGNNEELAKLIQENPDVDIYFFGEEDYEVYNDFSAKITEMYFTGDDINYYVTADDIVEFLEERIGDCEELTVLEDVSDEMLDEETLKWANKNIEHQKVILVNLYEA